MQDDAGGIDDAAEGRAFERGKRVFDARLDGGGAGAALTDLVAGGIERPADLGDDDVVGEASEQRSEPLEDLMDGWQVA
jgi:hypothetical protein